jgi:hypothetical protein
MKSKAAGYPPQSLQLQTHRVFGAQGGNQSIDVGVGGVEAGCHPNRRSFGNSVAPDRVDAMLFQQALLHPLRVVIARHALQPEAGDGAVAGRVIGHADFHIG